MDRVENIRSGLIEFHRHDDHVNEICALFTHDMPTGGLTSVRIGDGFDEPFGLTARFRLACST